jgi:hypothetical protein
MFVRHRVLTRFGAPAESVEQYSKETHTLAELRKSTGQPTAGYYDDVLAMPTQSGTQWDALCHSFWRGQMYNGHSAGDAGTAGSRSNGVQHYTGKIVTRGVFVDLAEYRGVDTLDPGYAITADDLDEYLATKNLQIRPGDALLIRTGFMGVRRGNWGDYAGGPSPGLSLHTATWIRDNDIAAVATDTWGIEVLPNEIDCWQPLHVVSLAHTGRSATLVGRFRRIGEPRGRLARRGGVPTSTQALVAELMDAMNTTARSSRFPGCSPSATNRSRRRRFE